MVHYNSWYDFYSYQDEGFNGGFKDPSKDPELIARLRPDRMNETSCLERVEAFGQELVVKRGTAIDSFLWDDGWDDTESLWQFDPKRFPRRFDPVSDRAKSFGVGTGVWISPWGGYGFPQESRVRNGKRHGWETNWNAAVEAEAFSLAGPRYRKAFRDLALGFVREQGVNMFKFDGVAGDPRELAVEMEAMLRLINDLREATALRGPLPTNATVVRDAAGLSSPATLPAAAVAPSASSAAGGGSGKKDKDAIWINLTTGTWASPFFLLWADSIWRGGPDIAGRPRDWNPDPGFRNDGLSKRQRWIRWRNTIVFVLVVLRSTFFPLSQLMIHGVIVASHGDALHWGLDTFDEVDFAQEVWSFVALGLQLQELYVAPRYMTAQAWDLLAEGLQWARKESAVLRDSHWVFGDPTERHVYATASWDVDAARGFIMLHNPTGHSQLSAKFTLSDAFELPRSQSGLRLEVRTVKSIFRPPADDDRGERLVGWTCSELPPVAATTSASVGGAVVAPSAPCHQEAIGSIQVRLLPTEVLVLEVSASAPSFPQQQPRLAVQA